MLSYKFKQRPASGQVLAGGTALMALLLMIAIGFISVITLFIGFCLNAYYQTKVAQAAEAGARSDILISGNLLCGLLKTL